MERRRVVATTRRNGPVREVRGEIAKAARTPLNAAEWNTTKEKGVKRSMCLARDSLPGAKIEKHIVRRLATPTIQVWGDFETILTLPDDGECAGVRVRDRGAVVA